MKRLITIISVLFAFSILVSGQIRGKVYRVADGDTFTLIDSKGEKIKVRLHGIDAPETGQPFSNVSKKFLTALILNKEVYVEVMGRDMYKRTLGVAYIDSINVNEEMIKQGLAWRYKYNKSQMYLNLQNEAAKNKRGLWQGNNPIDPWQWRKEKKRKNNTTPQT